MRTRKQLTIREPFCWADIYSLRFVVQVIFSAVILCFCFYQLTRGAEKDKNDALYWSCVSGILALWMPSPSSKPSGNDEIYIASSQASHYETYLEPSSSDRPASTMATRFERPLNVNKSDV
jgi:hypothetical protein